MIKKWKLFNFKSIYKHVEIETKPLTILAGANSSGKSTVLQSILLMSQTLSKRSNKNSLILNGPYVRLGQYNDVRSTGSLDNQIFIGWEITGNYSPEYPVMTPDGEWESGEEPFNLSCDLSFDTDSSLTDATQLQPQLFSCDISVSRSLRNSRLSLSHRLSLPENIDPNLIMESSKRKPRIYKAVEYLVHADEIMQKDIESNTPYNEVQVIGASFSHNLPSELLISGYQYNSHAQSEEAKYEDVIDFIDLPDYLSFALSQSVSTLVVNLKYLGPLRDEPKALYPYNFSADPGDVGFRGENTASVLEQNKTKRINYISSEFFEKASITTTVSIRTLETAVNDWLVYLDVAESVQTTQIGKLGHEMKVKMQGDASSRDLTHVGVGISQVLPILVLCLLAEPDSIIVLEQPELHLHPKVQTRLADFFLSMAMLGKQCIIETHSEYIINRLRFRAAAAQADAVSSLMKIYFVEKVDGCSVFNEVEVNKYGAIHDWPKGFFDQSQREAEEILRAGLTKKMNEKKPSN